MVTQTEKENVIIHANDNIYVIIHPDDSIYVITQQDDTNVYGNATTQPNDNTV
jgi:hypothetical protein